MFLDLNHHETLKLKKKMVNVCALRFFDCTKCDMHNVNFYSFGNIICCDKL
jgi:hypothetical protein